MALLFADGFDGKKFLTEGNNWILRNGGNYNGTPTFATGRKGSGSTIKGTTGTAQAHERYFVFPSTQNNIIVGFAWRRPTISNSNIIMIYFGTATSFVTNSLSFNSSTGVVSFNNNNNFTSSLTSIASSTGGQIPTAGTWNYWEVKVTFGTTGSIEVRKDGGVVIPPTTVNTVATAIDRVGIHLGCAGSAIDDYTGSDAEWDDLYICNTTGTVNNAFLGDVDVLNRGPNNNGTNSELLGSDGNSTDNYALVSGGAPASTVAPDNATYVQSTGIGSKDTYNYYDIPTTGTIKGVVVNSFASKSDTANSTGRNLALLSGTTVSGADFALSTAWQETYTVLEHPPTLPTGDWTPGLVNSTEFGWEHRTP